MNTGARVALLVLAGVAVGLAAAGLLLSMLARSLNPGW